MLNYFAHLTSFKEIGSLLENTQNKNITIKVIFSSFVSLLKIQFVWNSPDAFAVISNSEYLVRNPVQAALRSNKRRKAIMFLNIFGWDPRGPGTYSKFVQSPLMIVLWMEECQILVIFSYFSWKWRWIPAQD